MHILINENTGENTNINPGKKDLMETSMSAASYFACNR